MSRRICVVTTTRADYGLLRWVMQEISRTPGLQLQVLATGTHLAAQHGMTVSEIEADGFAIDSRVDLRLDGDSGEATAAAMGRALEGAAEAFGRLRPDLVLVLGDRYEAFAIAAAATVMRTPLAHIAGGDTTEGAFDEAFRHGITKMAQLHFVTNAQAQDRVIQMGEDPARVHDVGSPGIDSILRMPVLDRAEVERRLQFSLRPRNLLVTFHPVTLDPQPSDEQMAELLAALDSLGSDYGLIFTRPNADPEGDRLSAMLDAFAAGRDNTIVRASLGSLLYFGTMRCCDAVVGNSSSGLYEAPSLKRPTVDIGERQRGRLAAASVLHCAPRRQDIVSAIEAALRLDCSAVRNPYGDGGASARIADIIAREADLRGLLHKRFHLLRGSA